MIRCVRLWTGDDNSSHFEEGFIELEPGQRGDFLFGKIDAVSVSFQETESGGAFAWHTAPIRQLVVTLSGTLDFQTRDGHHFLIHPGNVLLAEDTAGSGHSWKLTDDSSWRRAYVVLRPGAEVPFRAKARQSVRARSSNPEQQRPTKGNAMPEASDRETDVVLIGAGIMSATLGVFLKELEPSLAIQMFEVLEDCALESPDSWNNAGTGHAAAANCEINYTPARPDGSIDISKALQVNVEFDLSRQFWSYLIGKGAIADPRAFIHPVPHMSFVHGAENVAFPAKRRNRCAVHGTRPEHLAITDRRPAFRRPGSG